MVIKFHTDTPSKNNTANTIGSIGKKGQIASRNRPNKALMAINIIPINITIVRIIAPKTREKLRSKKLRIRKFKGRLEYLAASICRNGENQVRIKIDNEK